MEIKISKYKNIGNSTIVFDRSKPNVIVGNNGSGKTNIIEILLDLYNQEKLPNAKSNFGREIFNKRLIHYSSGESKRLYRRILGYKNPNIKSIDTLNLKLIVIANHIRHPNREIVDFEIDILKSASEKVVSKYSNAYFQTFFKEHSSNKDSKKGRITYRKHELLELIKPNRPNNYSNEIDYFDFFEMLRRTRLLSDYSASRKSNVRIFFKNGDERVEFEDLGEGEQLLISLQSTIEYYSDGNSIFIFDEPDAYLFPEKISDMVKEFQELNGKDLLIITTHSANLISKLKAAVIHIVSDGNVYSIDSLSYGKRVDIIQEEVMHISKYPQEIQDAISIFSDYLDTNLNQAKEILDYFRRLWGENSEDYIYLQTKYEIWSAVNND